MEEEMIMFNRIIDKFEATWSQKVVAIFTVSSSLLNDSLYQTIRIASFKTSMKVEASGLPFPNNLDYSRT